MSTAAATTTELPPHAAATKPLDRHARNVYWMEHKFELGALVTDEQMRACWRRDLDVDCPDCGTKQPAGTVCWVCVLALDPVLWYDRHVRARETMSDKQRAALEHNRGKLFARRADKGVTKAKSGGEDAKKTTKPSRSRRASQAA